MNIPYRLSNCDFLLVPATIYMKVSNVYILYIYVNYNVEVKAVCMLLCMREQKHSSTNS